MTEERFHLLTRSLSLVGSAAVLLCGVVLQLVFHDLRLAVLVTGSTLCLYAAAAFTFDFAYRRSIRQRLIAAAWDYWYRVPASEATPLPLTIELGSHESPIPGELLLTVPNLRTVVIINGSGSGGNDLITRIARYQLRSWHANARENERLFRSRGNRGLPIMVLCRESDQSWTGTVALSVGRILDETMGTHALRVAVEVTSAKSSAVALINCEGVPQQRVIDAIKQASKHRMASIFIVGVEVGRTLERLNDANLQLGRLLSSQPSVQGLYRLPSLDGHEKLAHGLQPNACLFRTTNPQSEIRSASRPAAVAAAAWRCVDQATPDLADELLGIYLPWLAYQALESPRDSKGVRWLPYQQIFSPAPSRVQLPWFDAVRQSLRKLQPMLSVEEDDLGLRISWDQDHRDFQDYMLARFLCLQSPPWPRLNRKTLKILRDSAEFAYVKCYLRWLASQTQTPYGRLPLLDLPDSPFQRLIWLAWTGEQDLHRSLNHLVQSCFDTDLDMTKRIFKSEGEAILRVSLVSLASRLVTDLLKLVPADVRARVIFSSDVNGSRLALAMNSLVEDRALWSFADSGLDPLITDRVLRRLSAANELESIRRFMAASLMAPHYTVDNTMLSYLSAAVYDPEAFTSLLISFAGNLSSETDFRLCASNLSELRALDSNLFESVVAGLACVDGPANVVGQLANSLA